MSTNTLQTQSMQNIKTYKADGWSWSWINGWSNHEESSSFFTTAEDIAQAYPKRFHNMDARQGKEATKESGLSLSGTILQLSDS